MPHPDAWLFLPPEVEALVPGLMGRLGLLARLGGDPEPAPELRRRIESLIVEGDVEGWRAFLREAAALVTAYDGQDVAARAQLATILDDQFLLARAVVDLEDPDLEARRGLFQAGARPPRSSRAD